MGKEESGDEDSQGEGRAGEIKQGRGAVEGLGEMGKEFVLDQYSMVEQKLRGG